jgi:hypothetical protein
MHHEVKPIVESTMLHYHLWSLSHAPPRIPVAKGHSDYHQLLNAVLGRVLGDVIEASIPV